MTHRMYRHSAGILFLSLAWLFPLARIFAQVPDTVLIYTSVDTVSLRLHLFTPQYSAIADQYREKIKMFQRTTNDPWRTLTP